MEKARIMYDLAHKAFETDSTRLITLMLDSVNSPAIEVEGTEITDGYHSLSHHGKSPSKLAQLESIDREHMKLLERVPPQGARVHRPLSDLARNWLAAPGDPVRVATDPPPESRTIDHRFQ